MTRRVYIVNKGPHNFELAEAYGELVFCTDGNLDRTDLAQMHRIFSDVFKDSEPTDMLLLTSLSSLCSVACSVFAVLHGELHLLIHKGPREEGYFERSIFFD